MKQPFYKKHPYIAVILLALLCTFLTALGSAVPQIMQLNTEITYIIMTIAVTVSAVIGVLIMKGTHIPLGQFGFAKSASGSAKSVLFYLPLLLLELLPIFLAGFNTALPAPHYIILALFTIGVGFNEEIYFRGLSLRLLRGQGAKKAILWSSIIFGVLHIANVLGGKNLPQTILQICFAFLVGFVLAEIVCITQSLWVVIGWHAAHDFIAYTTNDVPSTTNLILIGIQVAILAVYGILLWKKATTQPNTVEE